MSKEQEWVQILLDNAEKLRTCGVRALRIGDCEAHLSPPEPELVPREYDPQLPHNDDPFYDPDTYGGPVPGLQQPIRRDSFDG